jgi:hypothetical protein
VGIDSSGFGIADLGQRAAAPPRPARRRRFQNLASLGAAAPFAPSEEVDLGRPMVLLTLRDHGRRQPERR